MAHQCPKCNANVSDDHMYCPHCGHGLKPSAHSPNVSAAGALMMLPVVAGLVLSSLSVKALLLIHNWYPQLTAQSWFVHDSILTGSSIAVLLAGVCSVFFVLARRNYTLAVSFILLTLVAGTGAWIVSLIVPDSRLQNSLLYYFLPMVVTPLVTLILTVPRKAEFRR